MKLFVTDAQLAAMRREITEDLDRYQGIVAEFVKHLQGEVGMWRLLYTAERQRNDVSTDQRLAERGLGAITGPTRPLAAEKMPSTLEELLRSTELGAVGDAAGVAR